MGLTAEPLHQGKAGTADARGEGADRRRCRWARCWPGAAGWSPCCPGAALMAGSACTRFGIFEAGQASARDPKYTVVPQRERVDRGEAVRHRA